MRVVPDTNALISGIYFGGFPGKVLQARCAGIRVLTPESWFSGSLIPPPESGTGAGASRLCRMRARCKAVGSFFSPPVDCKVKRGARPFPLRAKTWTALAAGLAGILALFGTAGAEARGVLPVRSAIQYQGLFARPLEERILPAPAPVLDLVQRYNRRAGVDLRPAAAPIDHPLVPLLRSLLRSLPGPLYRLASHHLAAIFLVEGNFGSARAEGLRDPSGRLVGGFMVLNLTALARPANAWATMRENSAFRCGGDVTIEVILEPPATNTPEGALRFIFLHELGHVLGMGLGVHGHWGVPESLPRTMRSPFARISWRPDGFGGLHSPAKRRFPLLDRLRFYRFERASLPRSAAPLVYAQLARTGFPSLYGTLDPYEDFAETFALYVHTRILGKPWAVVVRNGGRVSGIYRSCLQSSRCPTKAALIERMLTGRR